MDVLNWISSLEEKYCAAPHYLKSDVFGDPAYLVQFGSLVWDGSRYPELFTVTIRYDKETLLIKAFSAQRVRELSSDARGLYQDRPISQEKAREFIRSFAPYVSTDPASV